jgi:uridine kinase
MFYKKIFYGTALAYIYLQRFVDKAKSIYNIIPKCSFKYACGTRDRKNVWSSYPDQMRYLQHIQTNYEQQVEEMGKTRDVVVESQQQRQR